MIVTRACISINNRCNLACKYCHFAEKKSSITEYDMDIFLILDNIKKHIEKHNIKKFTLGFVGNGEPLLDYDKLKEYIEYISKELEEGIIEAYTITNGILLDSDMLRFFKEHNINVGFSLDGVKEIHDKYRCNTFDLVLEKVNLYHSIYGCYPSFNATVGKEILLEKEACVDFFSRFNSKVTFSRMIGEYSISLLEYHAFLDYAKKRIHVRVGEYDCTMYGGKCAAGLDNIFFANGKIYICGNCIDLDRYSYPYDTDLDLLDFRIDEFDRTKCFKENMKK